jgi:hypothetical protein
MRSRINVAAAHIVAKAASRSRRPSRLTSRIYRRLLIETALAFGYRMRLEQRSPAGSCVIRFVEPVSFNADAPGYTEGLLTARLIRMSQPMAFSLDEIDRLTLVTAHLPHDAVHHGVFTVGDAVRDEQYGFGVIQCFAPVDGGVQARVLFSLHGVYDVPDAEAQLTVLDSAALSRKADREAAHPSVKPKSA